MEESEASIALLGVWTGRLDEEVKPKDFIDRYEAISLLLRTTKRLRPMMEVACRGEQEMRAQLTVVRSTTVMRRLPLLTSFREAKHV